MRLWLLLPLAGSLPACGGNCGQDPPEFILLDEPSPIGIVPADAIAELPETFLLQGRAPNGDTGEVTLTVRSRPGDPVFINAWKSRTNADWCPDSTIRLPVAIEVEAWIGGSFTVAGHKFIADGNLGWQPALQGWQTTAWTGFNLPTNDDGTPRDDVFLEGSVWEHNGRLEVSAWASSETVNGELFFADGQIE